MPTPQEVYPVLLLWLQACAGPAHPTAGAALAHLVTALLVGQSLRPSALMRALVSPQPVPARQRYRRGGRGWARAPPSPPPPPPPVGEAGRPPGAGGGGGGGARGRRGGGGAGAGG